VTDDRGLLDIPRGPARFGKKAGAVRLPPLPRKVTGSLVVAPAVLLLLLLFVAPLAIFTVYSFYKFSGGVIIRQFTLDTWRSLWQSYYFRISLETLYMAGWTTLFTLLVGYPIAYAMAIMRSGRLRLVLSVIIFMPLTVSVVVRAYGWQVLLSQSGPVPAILGKIGLHPQLLFNMTGVVIASVQVLLPFAVFPIYASLASIDGSLREASADLGAGWLVTLRRIVIPLSAPGTAAAAELTFTLALGNFVIPAMLGGGRVLVIPLVVFQDTGTTNWPVAAALGLVLTVGSLIAVALLNRIGR
jgi:putative spermidine/putrescine transport system permease protein